MRGDLHLRGVIRNNLPSSPAASSITQQMLPGAFHSTLRDSVSQLVTTGGDRACRMHGPAEARAMHGAMVAPQLVHTSSLDVIEPPGMFSEQELDARLALSPVTASASSFVASGGTTVRFQHNMLYIKQLEQFLLHLRTREV